MKKLKVLLMALALVFALAIPSGVATAQNGCVSIQDKVMVYSSGHYLAGELMKPGFDIFGYNYQAHLFNGYYCNVYLGKDGLPPYEGDAASYLAQYPQAAAKWYWPYRDDTVMLKWNDAWISNKSCDGDFALDRHFGFPSYIGSGAWETNHQSGVYTVDDKEYHWTYFCKIVAAPADAYKTAGIWYSADGETLGPDIWGEFIVIQEVYNDPGAGFHGLLSKSPVRPGLGNW